MATSTKIPGILTPSQEAFARHYVQTGNAAKSYRIAYGKDENSRDEWVYVEACRLLDHPKVAPRIEELRDNARKQAHYTTLEASDHLEEIRLKALQDGQYAPAVSAINSRAKLFGLDAPSKVELSGPDGGAIEATLDVTRLSDTALSEIAALSDESDD